MNNLKTKFMFSFIIWSKYALSPLTNLKDDKAIRIPRPTTGSCAGRPVSTTTEEQTQRQAQMGENKKLRICENFEEIRLVLASNFIILIWEQLHLVLWCCPIQDDVEVAVEAALDVVRPARAAVGLVRDRPEPHVVDRLVSEDRDFFSFRLHN